MKQRHFHIVPLVVSLDGSAIHNTRVDAIFTTRKAVQNVQPTWASESYARKREGGDLLEASQVHAR